MANPFLKGDYQNEIGHANYKDTHSKLPCKDMTKIDHVSIPPCVLVTTLDAVQVISAKNTDSTVACD